MVNPPIEKWASPEVKLSILRKAQEMTMQAVGLSKPFSVDVFSDGGPIDQSPWMRLGEFERIDEAIATCKVVILKYLNQRRHLAACPDSLATDYLQHGPVPCINGVENLQAFDLYQYLNDRCVELTSQD